MSIEFLEAGTSPEGLLLLLLVDFLVTRKDFLYELAEQGQQNNPRH